MTKQFPDQVTIPTPMPTTRARGVYATGKFGANVKVRTSLIDQKLITEVAEALNMSRADFIRWCAVRVADELKRSM